MADVAKVYARAFLDAKAGGSDKAACDAFLSFAQSCEKGGELERFLSSPTVPEAAKFGAIDSMMGSAPGAANFAKLLVRSRRVSAATRVGEELRRLLDSRDGLLRVVVESPYKLEEKELSRIAESMRASRGAAKAVVEERVVQGLIGGPVVRIGSERIDASLRGRIRSLSREMKE
jgi:F-type H+-transporting ATPase subunit delta